MYLLIILFWFVVFTKKLFFWVYLWQLKEYHIGRFRDHLRTDKGKKLIFNYWLALKVTVFLLFVLLTSLRPIFLFFIFLIFLTEFIFTLRALIRKKFRIPVLTKKTSLILSSGISFELLIISFLFGARASLNKLAGTLLFLDILAPMAVTFLVFTFQPLTLILRERTIRAAKKKIRSAPHLLTVGITGSYGKTSTKEFLATILAKKYRVLKTKEHQNSEMGISNCVLGELELEHEIFVAEMGAYNTGGIKLLSDIVKPKIGILTGINEQHMATFGSQEKIIRTKFELIESLPADGLAILNKDNVHIQRQGEIEYFNPKLKNIKFYSTTDPNADIWAENISVEKESVFFRIKTKNGDSADFQLNALGAHNVSNFLAAACCAKYLGMSLSEISKAAREISYRQSGMELKKGIYGLDIIDATYSANPSGVISHLDYLKIWPGKKILVMPCLIELGRASVEVHRRIGWKIAEVCDLAIITTSDRFEDLRSGSKVLLMEDPNKILEKIIDFARSGDIILLEGRVPQKLIDSLIK